jgi:hypothetical protein
MGDKNNGVVMNDENKENYINKMVGDDFGEEGKR